MCAAKLEELAEASTLVCAFVICVVRLSADREYTGIKAKTDSDIAHLRPLGREGKMRKLIGFILLVWLCAIPAGAPPVGEPFTWAQLALGGGYQCVLLVSNKTASDWTGNFYVFQGYQQTWAGRWWVNGLEYTGSDYFVVNIPSHGTTKLVLTGEDPVRVGYMENHGSQFFSIWDVLIST